MGLGEIIPELQVMVLGYGSCTKLVYLTTRDYSTRRTPMTGENENEHQNIMRSPSVWFCNKIIVVVYSFSNGKQLLNG